MRTLLLSLLAAATCASSHASLSRHGNDQSMRARLHRLRGGTSEDAAPSSQALTWQEIVGKLNNVPVFALVDSSGGLVGTHNTATDSRTITFYLDAGEAQEALRSSQQGNLAATITSSVDVHSLRLTALGLGAAFSLCKGFSNDPASIAEVHKLWGSAANFDGELKLQGSHALVAATKDALQTMCLEAGIETGCWTLPVLGSDSLTSSTSSPMFFTLADLKRVWSSASGGADDDSMPKDVKVLDLRMLVAQMQTDASPWSTLEFVAPPDAVELARELA